MKPVLLITLLLFLSAALQGQSKHVRAEGEGNSNETENPYYQEVYFPEGVSYQSLTLWMNDTRYMDSGVLYTVALDEKGRIHTQTSTNYIRGKLENYIYGLPYPISNVDNNIITEYTYDDSGNAVRMCRYSQLSSYSEGGASRITQQYVRKMQHEGQPVTIDGIKRNMDSVLARGPQQIEQTYNDQQIQYDQMGNPIRIDDQASNTAGVEEPPVSTFSTYTYQYSLRGMVLRQEQARRFMNSAGIRFYEKKVRTFQYDDNDSLTNTITYSFMNDSTSDMAPPRGKRIERRYHYNAQGQPDTITYLAPDGNHRHVIAYNKGEKAHYTIYRFDERYVDTVLEFDYRYTGNDLKEIRHYSKGQHTYSQNLLTYNNWHLPVSMVTRTEVSGNARGVLFSQVLLFYGDKDADAATARRSLYVPKDQRGTPRPLKGR
ncbi:MAG: hypothetical protein H0X33_04075 [Taibaiella sp.]|nr:hypothetical protein [Taibaiella sp.]